MEGKTKISFSEIIKSFRNRIEEIKENKIKELAKITVNISKEKVDLWRLGDIYFPKIEATEEEISEAVKYLIKEMAENILSGAGIKKILDKNKINWVVSRILLHSIKKKLSEITLKEYEELKEKLNNINSKEINLRYLKEKEKLKEKYKYLEWGFNKSFYFQNRERIHSKLSIIENLSAGRGVGFVWVFNSIQEKINFLRDVEKIINPKDFWKSLGVKL